MRYILLFIQAEYWNTYTQVWVIENENGSLHFISSSRLWKFPLERAGGEIQIPSFILNHSYIIENKLKYYKLAECNLEIVFEEWQVENKFTCRKKTTKKWKFGKLKILATDKSLFVFEKVQDIFLLLNFAKDSGLFSLINNEKMWIAFFSNILIFCCTLRFFLRVINIISF